MISKIARVVEEILGVHLIPNGVVERGVAAMRPPHISWRIRKIIRMATIVPLRTMAVGTAKWFRNQVC